MRKHIFDQLAVSFDDSDKFDLKSFNGKASDKDWSKCYILYLLICVI